LEQNRAAHACIGNGFGSDCPGEFLEIESPELMSPAKKADALLKNQQGFLAELTP
jgi:hypothetical protein